MKPKKQTREQRIRLLEHIVKALNERLNQIEGIIYEPVTTEDK
jgi:hypothetical protein